MVVLKQFTPLTDGIKNVYDSNRRNFSKSFFCIIILYHWFLCIPPEIAHLVAERSREFSKSQSSISGTILLRRKFMSASCIFNCTRLGIVLRFIFSECVCACDVWKKREKCFQLFWKTLQINFGRRGKKGKLASRQSPTNHLGCLPRQTLREAGEGSRSSRAGEPDRAGPIPPSSHMGEGEGGWS